MYCCSFSIPANQPAGSKQSTLHLQTKRCMCVAIGGGSFVHFEKRNAKQTPLDGQEQRSTAACRAAFNGGGGLAHSQAQQVETLFASCPPHSVTHELVCNGVLPSVGRELYEALATARLAGACSLARVVLARCLPGPCRKEQRKDLDIATGVSMPRHPFS